MTTLRKTLVVPLFAALGLAAAPPAGAVAAQYAAVVVAPAIEGPFVFVASAEAVIVPGLSYAPGAAGSCQAVIVPPPSSANVRCWVHDQVTNTRDYIVTTSIDVGVPAVQLGTGTATVNPDHDLNLCVEVTADGYTPPYQCANFIARGLPL